MVAVTGLMAAVCEASNLHAAWEKVRRNRGAAGVDRVTVERFEQDLDRRLARLQSDLRSGRYRPLPLRRVAIPKPHGGTRMLGVPTVRDRIAQTACLLVLEPIVEQELEEHTYAYRRGRSIHHAIYRVKELRDRGYRWVVDADIDAYFDSVDHAMLMETLGYYVKDAQVLTLIRHWLEVGVLDHFRLSDLKAGIAQGAPISPLLANLYLDLFDEIMADAGYRLVRYADDFVVLCKSEEQADRARTDVAALLEEFRLRLDAEKTQVVHFDQGFKYLGAIFVGGLVTMPPTKPKLPRARGGTARRAGAVSATGSTTSGEPGQEGPSRVTEAPAPVEGSGTVAGLPGLVDLAEVFEAALVEAVERGERRPFDPLVLIIENRLAAMRGAETAGGMLMERPFEGPRLIPISGLNEYAYCPRLFFFRHVCHLETRSQAMLAGKVLHERVDRARVEVVEDVIRFWSADVVAPRLGVTGRVDLVEKTDDLIYPVEFKKGAGPFVPLGVRLQLCAEAGALEETFDVAIPYGYVQFFETDHREKVGFSLELRRQMMDAIAAGRAIIEGRWVPEARYDELKCGPCSLRPTCLPWETMHLRTLLRRGGGDGVVHDLPHGAGLSAS